MCVCVHAHAHVCVHVIQESRFYHSETTACTGGGSDEQACSLWTGCSSWKKLFYWGLKISQKKHFPELCCLVSLSENTNQNYSRRQQDKGREKEWGKVKRWMGALGDGPPLEEGCRFRWMDPFPSRYRMGDTTPFSQGGVCTQNALDANGTFQPGLTKTFWGLCFWWFMKHHSENILKMITL